MTLQQTLLGIHFQNPTVLASGIWGLTAGSWNAVIRGGAGAVTTKSLWAHEHRGHPNPTVISTDEWSLNAVGLPDAGPEKATEEISAYMENKPAPLIANIVGGKVQEFVDIAEKIAPLNPDAFEVNISCPNVEDEFGKPFACSVTDAANVTKAVKSVTGKVPVFVKLSPNVSNIGEIAKSVADAGADGLTVINTVGPGMVIDLKTRKPILANRVGGVSGAAIKPVAVRCIADCYRATKGKLPIIGTGGVETGEDAIEMMIAGASLIGIGTALWKRGESVFRQICDEMEEWCTQNNVEDISELIGSLVL